MRLIDADELIDRLAKEPMESRTYYRANEIATDMPTAYDVDNVIQNLKEAVIPIIDLKMGAKINGIQQTDDAVLYEKAVEIVKSGGKDS